MKQTHLFLYLTNLVLVAVSILNNIPHKYDLIMTRKSWVNAQNYCRVMYSDLATVVSDTDWLRLKNEAASKGLAQSAWVGLYDDFSSWRWSLNDLPLKTLTYTNWNTGQPNNAMSLEACVVVYVNGSWLDTSCTFRRAFICYNASSSDTNKFIGNRSLVTWFEALAYCRRYHTDLASSLNSSDQAMLTQLRNIQGDSWIGLSRDTWKWSDGTNTSSLLWASGQPDNSERIMGSCASVNNGLLSDEPCTNLRYFFCQSFVGFPRMRSLMKLQLKTNENVSDPAVQASISDKIAHKFEQKGWFNTTVTWRVQPDGNIFCKNAENAQSGSLHDNYCTEHNFNYLQ